MAQFIYKHRRGTSEKWQEATEIIPHDGELVVEERADGRFAVKVGDGIHIFRDLPYVSKALVAKTEFDFNRLIVAENVGETVSYNNTLYLIIEGANGVEAKEVGATGGSGGEGGGNLIAKTVEEMDALLVVDNIGKMVTYLGESTSGGLVGTPFKVGDVVSTFYINKDFKIDFESIDFESGPSNGKDGVTLLAYEEGGWYPILSATKYNLFTATEGAISGTLYALGFSYGSDTDYYFSPDVTPQEVGFPMEEWGWTPYFLERMETNGWVETGSWYSHDGGDTVTITGVYQQDVWKNVLSKTPFVASGGYKKDSAYVITKNDNNEVVADTITSETITKTSELENDSGFITIDDVPEVPKQNALVATSKAEFNSLLVEENIGKSISYVGENDVTWYMTKVYSGSRPRRLYFNLESEPDLSTLPYDENHECDVLTVGTYYDGNPFITNYIKIKAYDMTSYQPNLYYMTIKIGGWSEKELYYSAAVPSQRAKGWYTDNFGLPDSGMLDVVEMMDGASGVEFNIESIQEDVAAQFLSSEKFSADTRTQRYIKGSLYVITNDGTQDAPIISTRMVTEKFNGFSPRYYLDYGNFINTPEIVAYHATTESELKAYEVKDNIGKLVVYTGGSEDGGYEGSPFNVGDTIGEVYVCIKSEPDLSQLPYDSETNTYNILTTSANDSSYGDRPCFEIKATKLSESLFSVSVGKEDELVAVYYSGKYTDENGTNWPKGWTVITSSDSDYRDDDDPSIMYMYSGGWTTWNVESINDYDLADKIISKTAFETKLELKQDSVYVVGRSPKSGPYVTYAQLKSSSVRKISELENDSGFITIDDVPDYDGITDVQVDGTSAVVDGVANIPAASDTLAGVVTTGAQTFVGVKNIQSENTASGQKVLLSLNPNTPTDGRAYSAMRFETITDSGSIYPYIVGASSLDAFTFKSNYAYSGNNYNFENYSGRKFTINLNTGGYKGGQVNCGSSTHQLYLRSQGNYSAVPTYDGTLMSAPETWTTGTSGSAYLPQETGLYEFSFRTPQGSNEDEFSVFMNWRETSVTSPSIKQGNVFYCPTIDSQGLIRLFEEDLNGGRQEIITDVRYRKIGIA